MDKYTVLVYETRKQQVEVKAASEEEAIAAIREMQQKGMLRQGELSGMDFDVLDREPLRVEELQRFEIFGEQALFTEMHKSDIDMLQGIDKLYRYDLRHGDDDSYPVTLETDVLVNRFGTIFTMKPMLEHSMEYRVIGEDDWGFLSDLDDCTPEQFVEEMKSKAEPHAQREYKILQLNRANSVYAFMNHDYLLGKGVKLDASCYDSVYRGIMKDGMNLESLFAMFNINRPEDFRGHSLSVSDVIVLHDGASKTAHFVDSFGFKELPDFFDTPVKAKESPEIPANNTIKRTVPNEERT